MCYYLNVQFQGQRANYTCSFSTDFPKMLNIKFHQNPSSGSRFVPCGRTDMTKPIVSFRRSWNARKTNRPMLCGELPAAYCVNRTRTVVCHLLPLLCCTCGWSPERITLIRSTCRQVVATDSCHIK